MEIVGEPEIFYVGDTIMIIFLRSRSKLTVSKAFLRSMKIEMLNLLDCIALVTLLQKCNRALVHVGVDFFVYLKP